MGNNQSEELNEESTNRTEVVAVENNFVPPSTEVDVEENDEEVQPSSPTKKRNLPLSMLMLRKK